MSATDRTALEALLYTATLDFKRNHANWASNNRTDAGLYRMSLII